MTFHVVLVTTSYPDGLAGQEAAGSFVEDFAETLAQHLRVTVIAASRQASDCIEGNLRVVRFSVPQLPLSQLRAQNPADWPSIISALRSGKRALSAVAAEDKPDHVFALWALPAGYWAKSVAQEYAVPFSVWALGSDIWSLGRVPVVRQLLRSVLRHADRCYADGHQLASDVETLAGISCNFLPSTRLLPAPAVMSQNKTAPYKLAFLGRWHPNKGVDLMLEALTLLSEEDWARISEVRIYGGGPLEEQVTQSVVRLQGQSRPVSLGGYLGRQDAADLIGWANFLLLPSRIESIPVIFSDAMQLETPLVSTPIGDLPRLHEDYEFGVVADEVTSQSFAAAIGNAVSRQVVEFENGIERAQADFDLGRIVTRFVSESGMAC